MIVNMTQCYNQTCDNKVTSTEVKLISDWWSSYTITFPNFKTCITL